MQGTQQPSGQDMSQPKPQIPNKEQQPKPSAAPATAATKAVTAEGYKVDPKAAHLLHLEIEKHTWKQQPPPNPPVKTSTPQRFVLSLTEYTRFLEDNQRLMWHVNRIFHDPDPAKRKEIEAKVAEAIANGKRISN